MTHGSVGNYSSMSETELVSNLVESISQLPVSPRERESSSPFGVVGVARAGYSFLRWQPITSRRVLGLLNHLVANLLRDTRLR
jgi:hypothetical protein